MPLSPRTLRPANTFTPRSISGLALWLDASASGDLYTTDAGPVVPVSSPTEISGCLCWYDAADASSITKDGSNLVSQWNDKSGNNRHATASGSLRPTHAGSQNGRTVMQFTGSQAMTITGNFLQSDNVTMFAVAMKNTDHFGGIISSAPTNPEDSPILCFYSTTIAWLNRRVLVQQATGNGVYRIVSGQSSGSSQFGWFDGVRGTDTTTATPTNTTNTITKIGALRTSSTADLNGNIAEIVCYSGNLSPADRARVEAYLAQRWGISGVHAAATSASDPVGYWRDRSGNGRHATQATGANRPAVGSVVSNGRRGVNFGTASNSQRLSWVPSSGTQDWQEVFAVGIYDTAASTFADNHTMFGGTTSSLNDIGWQGEQAQNGVSYIYGTFARRSNVNAIEAVDNALVRPFPAITSPFLLVTRNTNNTQATGFQVGNDRTVANRNWRGRVCEVIAYARSLTSTERARVARYLASKYGIVLAPQVSNADAQDWIDRVYGNGGTVSAATAAAVNQFCIDIDAASIRDRFYRLNLFAGTGLNACLVPLYRGQSLGGTQFGNATDTNVGPFVSGDYVETGATGGLWYGGVGTNASKYLNTGLPQSAIPLTNLHLSASLRDGETTYSGENTLIGHYSASQSDFAVLRQAITTGSREFFAGSFSGAVSAAAASVEQHVLGVRSSATSATLYRSGSAVASSAANIGSVTTSALPYFVFARNNSGTPNNYTSARLRMYSIGTAMDGTAALAFANAVAAFNTAMGRA